MKRFLRRSAMVLACALLAGSTRVVAANYQLEGVGVPVGLCNGIGSDFTIRMDGSLVGCWYTSIADAKLSPSGAYHESGSETFVGCLWVDGQNQGCGTFDTSYDFHAKFTPAFQEINGRCQHIIVSGTGVFADGRVDFKDDVVNGVFYYHGHIAS